MLNSVGGQRRNQGEGRGRNLGLDRLRQEAALASALHRAMREQLTASTTALLRESTARDAADAQRRE